jgi:putative flippase GtrA
MSFRHMSMNPSLVRQAWRYLVAVSGGLLLDIGVAWCLIGLGQPDAVAAAGGMGIAFLASLAMHARWTFGQASASRAVLPYAAVCATVWCCRAAVLPLLDGFLPGQGWQAGARLALGAAITFPVGFSLSRLVFRGGQGLPAR